MKERTWHLQNFDLFQMLSPEELKLLEARSRTRTFPARSTIYLPQERADSVFLVAEGTVKISNLSHEGKQTILAYVQQGELFGELALLDQEIREEMVEAIEQTTVVKIPASDVLDLLALRADIALAVTKLVGLRRQRIERRLKNLLFRSSRERLIHLLLDLEEQFGQPSAEGIRLKLRLSHQDLGNLTGATRETITGLLGQLRAEGFLNYRRCRIVLTNPTRLAQAVHRAPPIIRPQIPPQTCAHHAFCTF